MQNHTFEGSKECPSCHHFGTPDEFGMAPKACNQCYNKRRKYVQNNALKHWAASTLNNHKFRGIDISVSQEWLENRVKNVTHCEICEHRVYFSRYVGKNKPWTITIDRIDSNIGVTEDNVAILCHKCNSQKGEWTLEEYRAILMKKISNIDKLISKSTSAT